MTSEGDIDLLLKKPPQWPPLSTVDSHKKLVRPSKLNLVVVPTSENYSGLPYLELRTFPNGSGPDVQDYALVRVRIMGMSDEVFDHIVKEGRCPLCGRAQHELVMCPMMPNELRPFC